MNTNILKAKLHPSSGSRKYVENTVYTVRLQEGGHSNPKE
jgi:hypothetical protein